MASENAHQIIKTVIVTLPKDAVATDADIQELAGRMRGIFPVSDNDFDFVLRTLYARLPHRQDLGSAVVAEDHVSWYYAKKADITPYYWERYEEFLIKEEGWTPSISGSLDQVTDKIMDYLGNPKHEGAWKRRGLVMGDVQSGKTSTYIALSCKGADAGYKLIILLAGTLENLRRQTQERLDAGFIGLDSSLLLAQHKQNKLIGVGLIDNNRNPAVFTSVKNDFKSDLANQLGLKVDAHNEPILVVVKKNKRILENLETWLRNYNADVNGKIETPLLLIDDEADNASVNTSNGNTPTAINQGIRSILGLFTRSTYVGFTATPFANIFIDPDSEDEMLKDDLFPNDFIYSLDAPTNYIGADAIFNPDGDHTSMLKKIEDAYEWMPTPHNSAHRVEGLPDSLETALRCFIIANAIRDLRSEGSTHRSMLVNVSRFTDVQEDVATVIDRRLRQIQQDIRNYSQLPDSDAIQNKSISLLYKVWDAEYSDAGFTWDQVRSALLKAALPIVVVTVNQRKKKGKVTLDYKAHKQEGLRVIAVGGNSLSRGLTLEGLCVSYFYRNSQMYDTLMQMGRWFGYREGYGDLCRVWMSSEAIRWYRHIALATRELRNEIKAMDADGLTPREFGLKVRAHPDSVIVSLRNLIVTARNKSRTAKLVEFLVSFSAEGPETPHLNTDSKIVKANAVSVARLINRLKSGGYVHEPSEYSGSNIWREVPKGIIIDLLREFTVHSHNYSFPSAEIASFLEKTSEDKLAIWDVVIPNGSAATTTFAGIDYKPQKRTVELKGRGKYFTVSGSSARVGSRGVEREGIPKEMVDPILEEYRALKKNPSDKVFRNVRPKPLLLLHFLAPQKEDETAINDESPFIALGLSFPKFDDSEAEKKVLYQVNVIKWREMFEQEMDDDEEEEVDEA